MKLERGLDHQERAVSSIIRVFADIDMIRPDNTTQNPYIDLYAHYVDLKNNIDRIQENNKLSYDIRRKKFIGKECLNLDIKMETGTGKTYTQVRTIYELNAKYGFSKFIIVVPTLPIKAGTKQFILSPDTKQFFGDEFGTEIELRVVESIQKKKGRDYFPSVVREFVTSPCVNTNKIQVMLINSQLITNGKMLTKEYDTTILDDLTCPSEAIKSVKPILIIDEPHKFAKDNVTFKKINEILAPQCIIRFGATFPDKGKNEKDYQNLLFDLNSVDAFNKNLVKGVIAEYVPTYSDLNVRIKLLSIKNREKCVIQRIEETVKKSYELSKGDSLSIVHEDFDGVEISAITKNTIELSNGVEVPCGTELSPESYSMSYQDMMIETAIQRHFEVEKENFKNDIKTLALFFIDDISAYRKTSEEKETYILNSFERILKKHLEDQILICDDKEYKKYLQASLNDIKKCHAGYFSQDNNQKDEEIISQVNDILNDKEKILRIKDDDGKFNLRRFIFSKWTLKEGWDNPNIFTIAKLRSSGSEISKLQEVGRGLRIPVNSELYRMDGKQFYLNYIVDFTEQNFIEELRKEINRGSTSIEYLDLDEVSQVAYDNNISSDKVMLDLVSSGAVKLPTLQDPNYKIVDIEKVYEICPFLDNGVKRHKVLDRKELEQSKIRIRKEKYNQIKKLWELLNEKYIIKYDKFSNEDIEEALINILNQKIGSYDSITTQRRMLDVTEDMVNITEQAGISIDTNRKLKYNEFLTKLSSITNIPIVNIHNAIVKYSKTNKIDDTFFNNTVLINFAKKINDWKTEELFKRFTYKKANLPIHPTALTTEDGKVKEAIVLGNVGTSRVAGTPQEKYLYDTIAFDSDIEKDNILEQINEVTVFGKIPKSSIKIPVANGGTYSPDFMYLIDKKDGSQELNLVIESKDVKSNRTLRGDEDYRIKCAEKLFSELEKTGVNIKFKRQLSKDKIGTIVKNILY